MRKHWKYSTIIFLLLLLLPAKVRAAGAIDRNAPVSLTISAQYGDLSLEGMKFYAYQISSMEETGELTVNDRYETEREELDIRGKNDSAWAKMAERLERKILLERTILEDATAETDEKGVAVFSGLSQGLYLIRAEGVEQQGYVYTSSAFLAVLPEQDGKENEWNYQVVVHAKPERSPVTADYQVVKLWKDDCHIDLRPKSIEVTLYCDGQVYDTITLPENGRWEHTWKNLSVNHHWTVVEEQQKGYEKPQVSRSGNVFTIINVCNQPVTFHESGLPQTGQLWWPVPMLLSAGLLLMVMGVIRRKENLHEK